MFKKTLLLLGAMALATPAMAATEMTNPFYTPSKGGVSSVTSLDTGRTQTKGDGYNVRDYRTTLGEALRYGITDSISVDGTISNTWMKYGEKGTRADKEDTNVDFTVGGTYSYTTGPVLFQAGAVYGQKETEARFDKGAYKYLGATVKAGYDLGYFLPYASASIEYPVAQSPARNGGLDKNTYEAKVGAYKFWCDKIATDLGVRYTHDENYEDTVWSADLEASYFITPNWAVGAYGTYAFASDAKWNGSVYDKKIGLRLRAQF